MVVRWENINHYMFDHLDEAEPAEGGVVAGEDHHDGPALPAGHTARLATACQLRGLLGHGGEEFVLEMKTTIITTSQASLPGYNRQVRSQSESPLLLIIYFQEKKNDIFSLRLCHPERKIITRDGPATAVGLLEWCKGISR